MQVLPQTVWQAGQQAGARAAPRQALHVRGMLRGIWPEVQPGGPRADTSGGAPLYLFAVRERVSYPVQLADSHEAVSRQGTQALVSHGSNYSRAYRYTLAPLFL
jgi:hypothetical protein